MAERTTISKLAAFVLLYFIAVSCASQIPPKGGPPDTTPPEILEIYPPDQSINYDENTIEITFSEYVNKRSVQESIFISPNIEGTIEYDWSGTTVEIVLPDTLRKNTTYTITVGTDVEDINNANKLAQSYTFAFSTGDEIDRGTITGKVFDAKPAGVMIYAYKVLSDTLNPAKQKPDYITQTGKEGNFKLSGLADGQYRVFAVKDEFKDFIYDPTQDQYGAPFTEINLTDSDSLFSNLNYQLTIEDTTEPRVFGLTMTDQYHLLIEFSEPIDSMQVSAENFFVYDSTNNERTDAEYFFKGKTKPKNFLLVLTDTLKDSEQLSLISKDIPDMIGNLLEYESTSFVKNEKPDTLNNELFSVSTIYPGGKIDFINGWMRLHFLDGFDHSNFSPIVRNAKNENEEYQPERVSIDAATVDINFDRLKTNEEYEIIIDQKEIKDYAGNYEDTTLSRKFSTIDKLDFTGLSGDVIAEDSLNIVVSIVNLASDKIKYTSNGKQFNFEKVFPGKYVLSAFEDKNGNEQYDNGTVYPFTTAERFVFYPDTLELKARWPVGDVKLKFE